MHTHVTLTIGNKVGLLADINLPQAEQEFYWTNIAAELC